MQLKKAPPAVSEINVTPMVDVMLVLLIIFMVITPMLSKGVNVNMVKTHNPIKMVEADKEDAILVAVTRDGKVFLSPGNSLTLPEQLGPKVKDLQQNRQDKTVYLKADARARFSSVTDVIDNLRTAGVDSAARRAAFSVRMCWPVGMRTFPPRWPHFFSEASWSSQCTPAAPAAIMDFISSKALSTPPNPASASATMGASQYGEPSCPGNAATSPSFDSDQVIWSARSSALLIRRTTWGTELTGYRLWSG